MADKKPIRRIVVHPGLPKTGTTTTQNTLFSQREKLLSKYKLLYPSLQPNHTDAICSMFLTKPMNHITNRSRGYTDESVKIIIAEYRAALEKEINDTDWQTLLISAEGMSNLSLAELKNVREWLSQWSENIQVQVYVRSPLDYSRSVIQQHLKGGDTLKAMYEKPPLANFKNRVLNLHRAFGREHVDIFSFDAAKQQEESLSQVFLRNINPKFDLIKPELPLENQSMSLQAALVLNSLNIQIPKFTDGKPNPLRSERALNFIMELRGDEFELPKSVKLKIIKRAKSDVASLNDLAGRQIFDENEMSASLQSAENTEHILRNTNRKTIASIARLLNNV